MNYYAVHWILLMAVKIVYIDILGNDRGILYFWVQCAVAAFMLPLISFAIDRSRILQKYLMGKKL